MKRLFVATILAVCISTAVGAQTASFYDHIKQYNLVDVSTLGPGITVDLKYATTDNFVHRNMYGDFKTAYLHPDAAKSLKKALLRLRRIDKQFGFIIYDAARPVSVQRIMWNAVAGTPNQKYVARPHRGGPHNYGIAVDIGLTFRGKPVDMGTPFDTFSADAHITNERALVHNGRISERALRNRLLLRAVLTSNGFTTFSREWWHFTRYDMKYTRAHIRLLNF